MTIEHVTPATLDELRRLLRDYAAYVRSVAGAKHICLTAYEEELANLTARYSVLLLASDAGQAAGCALLKRIVTVAGESACEMKRLWVTPAFRGRQVGRLLTEWLMKEARALGYAFLYLDTIPSKMGGAIALYRSMGFEPVEPYNRNRAAGVQHFRVRL